MLLFCKEIWWKLHYKMVKGDILMSSECSQCYISNITVKDIAESLFRLSINTNHVTTAFTSEKIRSTIFGSNDTALKDFWLNHWEISPTFVGRLPIATMEDLNILHSIKKSSDLVESPSYFVSSMLENLLSCPPIASDESDILNFLNEVRDKLGCPLMYEQDIRVLRTEALTGHEVHFFPRDLDNSARTPHFLSTNDILKCEEAFKQGYTIALRGMEFRFESVASVACGLASLFGQPSVGANLYLTPPNSQGLAVHYDDHCVFVCQILGTKRWKIATESTVKVPRLYAPCSPVNRDSDGGSAAEYKELELREGDVLYIPRGFAHEAQTNSNLCDGSARFSLHLTLAVEVEPPFEWEGFIHVALHCWSHAQKQHHDSLGLLDLMSVSMLHLSIQLLGDSDPNFRRACLVASTLSPFDTDSWFHMTQKSIFRNLIDKIGSESRASEVVRTLELAIGEDKDVFQQMMWVGFLTDDEDPGAGDDQNLPFMDTRDLFHVWSEHKDMAENLFLQVKNRFCREVSFEDTTERYKRLLEKYKRVRRQYMNGMLSLHSTR